MGTINVIAFDSRTNNTARFVSKLTRDLPKIRVLKLGTTAFDLRGEDRVLLVTYTTGFGQVPQTTLDFLKVYGDSVKIVCSSGNTVWGSNFGKSLDVIADRYPHITSGIKFEMSGTKEDVEKVKEFII